MASRRGIERRAVDRVGGRGVVVATRSHTLTGSVRSRAKQAICESTSYDDTILGRVWEGGRRGHGGCYTVRVGGGAGRGVREGFVVATRSHTLTDSVRSRAKQAICESISYHDTILGRVWERGKRGHGGCYTVRVGRGEREEEGYVHYSFTLTD